ncbi:DUF2271 domain-containing protein [Azonexus sp. R2A61]|uniref:DUF2271 domain-containing protein n=1 Tax=Azonexus sp. R2A61 TaxID=2744443 RepID=UPI001F1CE3FB|nr:DUF2271 domain-containing protein [Azonexus sp. R2A61]
MKCRSGLVMALALTALPAAAAELSVRLELPQLQVAEYHRPYIAMWLERTDQSAPITPLNVWYDQKKKDNGGTKWLKDMRQWWRKGGRDMQTPLDAVTAATRAPGVHNLSFTAGKAPLGNLAAGEYLLMVEASREAGGREVVRVPLSWPPKAAQSASAKGQEELGTVTVQLKP